MPPQPRASTLVTGIRVFLGLIFFTSGMGKLTHGDYVGLIGPVWLAERLAPYGLAYWATFVAWSQMAIGLMLLSRRWALLGAIMLVPLLTNILVVTISLQWRGTPYVNAVLLAMNLTLLVADRRRLMALITDREPGVSPRPGAGAVTWDGDDAAWLIAAGLCVAAVLLHPVNRYLTFGLSGAGLLLIAAARRWQAGRGAAATARD